MVFINVFSAYSPLFLAHRRRGLLALLRAFAFSVMLQIFLAFYAGEFHLLIFQVGIATYVESNLPGLPLNLRIFHRGFKQMMLQNILLLRQYRAPRTSDGKPDPQGI